MRGFVFYEESARVADAFRKYGWDMETCDIKPSRGNGKHHQMDAMIILLGLPDQSLDFAGMHPVCDWTTLAGNRHYGEGKDENYKRHGSLRYIEIAWRELKRVAKHAYLEHPKSVINKLPCLPKPQIIKLEWFGHEEMKDTCLYLHELPELKKTNDVGPPPLDLEERKKWEKVFRMAPGPNRKRDRSETRQGVADAMADQWTRHIREGFVLDGAA